MREFELMRFSVWCRVIALRTSHVRATKVDPRVYTKIDCAAFLFSTLNLKTQKEQVSFSIKTKLRTILFHTSRYFYIIRTGLFGRMRYVNYAVELVFLKPIGWWDCGPCDTRIVR